MTPLTGLVSSLLHLSRDSRSSFMPWHNLWHQYLKVASPMP